MTILEQVTQMKNQGIIDEEIVAKLQEQGISPKEINDALSQAQIKTAVSDTGAEESIMEQAPRAPSQQRGYTPQTQEIPKQEIYTPSPQEYSQPQEFYQDAYGDDYSAGGANTDTMIEISEQVFSEKSKVIQKQVESINEFKTLAQAKIDSIVERLKRIEATIDKLQIAILEKIGFYGKDLENTKKEMSMMQDSFGKIVNQAVEGHHKTHSHKTTKHQTKKTGLQISTKTPTRKISRKK